jgi:toxin secretion/phage lysis holin
MKEMICTALGVIGGAVAAAFGGWSAGLTTLVVFMAADYATGLLAAGVFHASRKTAHGGLESRVGWKGLARKCVTLLLVLAACRLELLLGITYVRDAAVIGFCANELLSVTENAALMGVPLPRALKDALELLRKREEASHD